MQVDKAIRRCDPSQKDENEGLGEGEVWEKYVEIPAKKLEAAYATLSAGWGLGMGGMTGAFWAMGAGIFCLAIDLVHCMGKDEMSGFEYGMSQKIYMMEVAILLVLPLVLALDVASTSNMCLDLMVSLNRTRVESGYEHDLRISWLEKSLLRLNHDSVRIIRAYSFNITMLLT